MYLSTFFIYPTGPNDFFACNHPWTLNSTMCENMKKKNSQGQTVMKKGVWEERVFLKRIFYETLMLK